MENDRDMILSYFQENTQQREYFEEILMLRDKILEMEKEIRNIIEDYKFIFKKRNTAIKNGSAKTIQYDLIYSALFGNGIII